MLALHVVLNLVDPVNDDILEDPLSPYYVGIVPLLRLRLGFHLSVQIGRRQRRLRSIELVTW